MSIPDDRCGLCSACLHVQATQKLVLAAANPPFSHATQRDVDMWNSTLADNPCNHDPSTGNRIREREAELKFKRSAVGRRQTISDLGLDRVSHFF